MTAPIGRIPDEMLLLLADEAKKPVAQPEVVARFPYWSYVQENGAYVEGLPDDHPFETLAIYPPSLKDRFEQFYAPPDAFKPLAPAKPAKGDKVVSNG